ncbi:MAG: aspartate/glutamate racemase family protein [SAR202 cluster bacterium]|jgi:Asp/Glu/hydantoin racemase|nr:aspartate/glutamate racemase family protein [SAR202 cluster bacterium]|tara:strand:+ start:10254 stop:10910 length:657 start_codon:yes stop_codon:yes gene_type:complete
MYPVIRVINPNSNDSVTAGISEALEPLRLADGPRLECITLSDGPFGVESQADVSMVEPLIVDYIKADAEAAAFIIACYSDPGLALCREATDRPVFGIAECAMATALSRGQSFGVIAILSQSIPRHIRHMRERLLHNHCAGERALELTVAEVENSSDTYEKMLEVGTKLRDKDGAEVIIMGCAGMAKYRDTLEKSLGVPVIDPTIAAAGMAINTVLVAN